MLRERAVGLVEIMDAPDCDPVRLANTYRQFTQVNSLVAGWRYLYCRFLRPRMSKLPTQTRLLDVGCGGGDVLKKLVAWAARDGFALNATGIDPDERAIAYARRLSWPANVTLQCTDTTALLTTGEQFDIVISNHVLHHLTDARVSLFCHETQKLARFLVLHNDIRRHPLAYIGFPFLVSHYRNSYICEDGLRSIRRSFTPAELRALLPNGWQVREELPFRNVVLWRQEQE